MATLSGYGALFNVEAVIAGLFRERIAPGAFRDTIRRDDIRSLFNHDVAVVLGRQSAGTLELSEDAKGLRYTVPINGDDPAAAGVAARVARRDISGSSFWFSIDSPDDEEWTQDDPKKLPLRTLRKLRLVDVGPVSFPAYEATSVAVVTVARHDDTLIEQAHARLRLASARLLLAKARRI